ncbi:MAG: chondroitinase-B domain-containing protein [Bacteroidota bacterium]
MNRFLFWLIVCLLPLGLTCGPSVDGLLVHTLEEFNAAATQVQAGDRIVLANGVWKDTELKLYGQGTEAAPIVLTVQEKGQVFLEGASNLRIGGAYLHVEGLVFRNGYTPTASVISYQTSKTELCTHCRVTECVIDDYNPAERFDSNYWVSMYGKNNRFDHNYLVGKRNQGVTMAVRLNSPESQENHHLIDHNHFGYRPTLGSNGGESLRIGTSHHSLTNSNTRVENNYFEWCSGELEIISNKSGQNVFFNNTFFESAGTLTMRHGNETLVENNYFIGNGRPNTGGIRIINESQTVKNNFMQGLTGIRFRSALTIMNGVPNSPLNRYFQVKNSKASYNLLIDCDAVQLCAGSDEERSATPIDTRFEKNVFYRSQPGKLFTIYDRVDGIDFAENALSEGVEPPAYQGKVLPAGFVSLPLALTTGADLPQVKNWEEVGPDRSIERPTAENTGPSWYARKDYRIQFNTGKEIQVQAGENSLSDAIKQSQPGDMLVLAPGEYHQTKAIDVRHPLTVRGADAQNQPVLTFERNSLFHIENKGSLKLKGLLISGAESDDKPGNMVIRSSRYAMPYNYQLQVLDCEIKDLDVNHSFHFLQVFSHTFADSIVLRNTTFSNITGNVLALDRETEDLGIYNAENVWIDQCHFEEVQGVALRLYRGGRDESTFGPILDLTNSTFERVGQGKRNPHGAAIDLHGVQLAKLDALHLEDTPGLRLHLIVGDPIIEVSNSTFVSTPSIRANSTAWTASQLQFK